MPWCQASQPSQARIQPEDFPRNKDQFFQRLLSTHSSVTQSSFHKTHLCVMLMQVTKSKQLGGPGSVRHFSLGMKRVRPGSALSPCASWVCSSKQHLPRPPHRHSPSSLPIQGHCVELDSSLPGKAPLQERRTPRRSQRTCPPPTAHQPAPGDTSPNASVLSAPSLGLRSFHSPAAPSTLNPKSSPSRIPSNFPEQPGPSYPVPQQPC